MMRDPVCGREFGLREAGAMSIWQGRAYLFCCAACNWSLGLVRDCRWLPRAVGKDTGAEVLYRAEPRALVDALILAYQERHFRRPSCFGGPVEAMPPPVEHLGTEPG